MNGDTVRYRTTVTADHGPARQITRIAESLETGRCGFHWLRPESASVTYTDEAGERVTDAQAYTDSEGYPAVGSWTVDPTAGTTVVYDSTYTFQNPNVGPLVGCSWGGDGPMQDSGVGAVNLDARLVVKADGLDALTWQKTGVTATCAVECTLPNPAGSVESFGS